MHAWSIRACGRGLPLRDERMVPL